MPSLVGPGAPAPANNLTADAVLPASCFLREAANLHLYVQVPNLGMF